MTITASDLRRYESGTLAAWTQACSDPARTSGSGSPIRGTPSGEATADMTRFSGCGGFSLLSVQVKDVNLADGSRLWVTLDFKPVGTITLRGGSGTMATYNLGFFGVSNDDVRVYSALPDVGTSKQILIGGAFQ